MNIEIRGFCYKELVPMETSRTETGTHHVLFSILDKAKGRCAWQWKIQSIKAKNLGHVIFPTVL